MDSINRDFKPTVEWMAQKYDEINDEYFGGRLGSCDFDIFTTGKGSGGNTLGWFKIQERSARAEIYSRRIYVTLNGERTYVDGENFTALCAPLIELNGNYTGTEEAFLGILVHEMCHYYTYMEGYAPVQGHGPEFRAIAARINQKSNGRFHIQRFETDMTGFELCREMKDSKERRMANKMSRLLAVVAFYPNERITLTTTTNADLALRIKEICDGRGCETVISNDKRVIDLLASKGYKRDIRTFRYWYIEDVPWLNELTKMLFENNNDESQTTEEAPEPTKKFVVKTSKGEFVCDATDEEALFNTLRNKFPNMSDETIMKLINNKANYKIAESRKRKRPLDIIIQEAINDVLGNKQKRTFEDDIPIAGINLGLETPFEAAKRR